MGIAFKDHNKEARNNCKPHNTIGKNETISDGILILLHFGGQLEESYTRRKTYNSGDTIDEKL